MIRRDTDIGANETVHIINCVRTETDWSIGKSGNREVFVRVTLIKLSIYFSHKIAIFYKKKKKIRRTTSIHFI
jgi:hypothetical protein